jgi:4-carboxymuconolactone decarboxylase
VATVVFGDYEWDTDKAATNLEKHGVSFFEAAAALQDPHAVYLDASTSRKSDSQPSASPPGPVCSTSSTSNAKSATESSAPDLPRSRRGPLHGQVMPCPTHRKPRLKRCLSCASLIATGKTEQMDFHFPNAIKNGVTREEIVEMITHLAFYVGWPNAMSAVNRAKALFETKEGT